MKGKVMWSVAIVACVVLAIANFRLSTVRSKVKQELQTLEQQHEQCLANISELSELQLKAKQRQSDLKEESTYIYSILAKAKGLSDLQGLTGNQIVAKAVRHRANDYSVFFYVPAGTHRLAYFQSETSPEQTDRRTAKMETIELEGKSSYQIRLATGSGSASVEGSENEIQFTLFGPKGKVTESSLAFSHRASGIGATSEVRCYPSQLSRYLTFHHQIGYDGAIGDLLKEGRPRLPVEIAVATILSDDNRESFLRFFIESDANVNLPADAVATWLPYLDAGNKSSFPLILNEVFEPYDGTGRYNFKRGFLEQCRAKVDEGP